MANLKTVEKVSSYMMGSLLIKTLNKGLKGHISQQPVFLRDTLKKYAELMEDFLKNADVYEEDELFICFIKIAEDLDVESNSSIVNNIDYMFSEIGADVECFNLFMKRVFNVLKHKSI